MKNDAELIHVPQDLEESVLRSPPGFEESVLRSPQDLEESVLGCCMHWLS